MAAQSYEISNHLLNELLKLKNRQYELNDKLKRVIEADENYSITLITLLNICSRAPELFESSKKTAY